MAEASRTFYTSLINFAPISSSRPPAHHHHHTLLLLRTSSRRNNNNNKNTVRCSVSTSDSNKVVVNNQKAITWGCDVDSVENASDLQTWLSNSGLPPQKMAIESVDVGERGLVALTNIRKGEKLLFVPPSLFITSDSV